MEKQYFYFNYWIWLIRFLGSNSLWNYIILMINIQILSTQLTYKARNGCHYKKSRLSFCATLSFSRSICVLTSVWDICLSSNGPLQMGSERQILIIHEWAQINAVSTLIHNFRSPTSLAAAPLKMGIMPSHSIPQLTTKQVWPKNSILSLNLILLSSFFMISWCHPHWFTFQRSPCGVKKNTINRESANCRVLKLLILADGWCVTVPLSVRRGIPPMKTYDRLALM